MSGPLAGAAVAVVGADTGAGSELVRGLEDLGASVAPIAGAALSSAGALHDALVAAATGRRPVDGVVVWSLGGEPTHRCPLVEVDADAWRAQVERPMGRLLACFQGAHRYLGARGGSVVLVVPTLSMTGAAGVAPWAAVTEGGRALARAAARAWGRDGVTVNCVAVPGALLTSLPVDETGAPPSLERPGLPRPALRAPDLRVDVAGW